MMRIPCGHRTMLAPTSSAIMSRRSRRVKSIPSLENAWAAVSPTGPPPTMMTLISIVGGMGMIVLSTTVSFLKTPETKGGKRCCTGTWVFIIHGRGNTRLHRTTGGHDIGGKTSLDAIGLWVTSYYNEPMSHSPFNANS